MRDLMRRALVALSLASMLLTGCGAPSPASANTALSASVSSIGAIAANRRRTALIPASVAYDTAMGTSVDVDGFAALPLRAGGTDGSNILSGVTPDYVTFQGTSSYSSSTRTLTSSGFVGGDNPILKFNGKLTIGQQYHVRGYFSQSGSNCGFNITNSGGGVQAVLFDNASGTFTKGFFDLVFTATGVDLWITRTNDGFSGTLTLDLVSTNSGGVGGHRFFVRPSTGSDSISPIQAQSPSTPLASIPAAMALAANGLGDQILVAEGSTIATLPNFVGRSGYSAAYPLVVETYDPADALNETKYGRAYQRSAWATVTNPGGSGTGGAGTLNYFALRGFEFNPGNVPDHALNFTGNASYAPHDNLLIEGNRFMYTGLSVDMSATTAQATRVIIRNNVNYGSYTNTEGARPSNVFLDNIKFTYEDNVNIHAGWKPGASRDGTIAAGGLKLADGTTVGYFMHPLYQTAHSDAYYVRRNLIADGAGDGGSWRGDIVFRDNLLIDNPVAMYITGGDSYDTKRPGGRMIIANGNGAIGAVNVTNTYPMAAGIVTENGQNGSEIYDNLLARGTPSSSNANAFYNNAQFNQPSYAYYHDNRAYLWTNAGSTYNNSGGLWPAQAHTTYGTNWTDDATSGSNVFSGSLTFPNAYATSDALAVARGYANKQAMLDYAIAHPVDHIQRAALTTLRTGYGMSGTIH